MTDLPTRRKLIIDTDAGVDDAQAILLALSYPDVDVVAITCVGGNTALENVTINVLRILSIANRLDIPVYAGCKAPVIGNKKFSDPYHGVDGLGDCAPGLLPEIDLALIQKEHACNALIRLAEENKNEITVACLAPLTNIAIAIRLDQNITKNLKSIYIMGGNHAGEGNETSAAEFNFHHDPEAASIVIDNSDCAVTIVGWEVCSQIPNRFDSEFMDVFFNQQSPQGRFVYDIHRGILAKIHEEAVLNGTARLWVLCDEWAVAAFLDENLIKESATWPTLVELSGVHTRGQCVVDKRWYVSGKASGENKCRHVLNFDVPAMRDLLMRMVTMDLSKI